MNIFTVGPIYSQLPVDHQPVDFQQESSSVPWRPGWPTTLTSRFQYRGFPKQLIKLSKVIKADLWAWVILQSLNQLHVATEVSQDTVSQASRWYRPQPLFDPLEGFSGVTLVEFQTNRKHGREPPDSA